LKIKASLELPKDLVKSVGLDEGGKVQKYIDSFVLYHSEPYVPGKHIHDSGVVATKIGSGKVIWDTPDANYLYEGKLMVDPITLKGAFFAPDYGFWSRPNTQKIMDPTGRDLVYHGGGLRGSHWFDRMIENEMDDLLDGIVKLIGGNNGK
jgi:hypothetical protein